MKEMRKFYVIMAIFLTANLLKYISPAFFDGDTFFLLATGREIVKNGIPYENPFHITPGLQIVVQQWLFCVITYLFYFLGNVHGLFIMTLLITALNGIMYWKIAKLKGLDGNIALITILLFFVLYCDYLTVRPNNLTVLLLLLQIYFTEKYVETGKKRWLAWLPLIMIVEANVHIAVWFIHILFMLPYIVPPFDLGKLRFLKVEYKIRNLVITSLAMVVSTICNPYGLDGVLYLVHSYTDELRNAGIAEMQPTMLISSFGLLLQYGLIVILLAAANKKKLSSPTIYLFIGTFILGAVTYRNNNYFSIAFLILVFEVLAQIDFTEVFALLSKMNVLVCVLFLGLSLYGLYEAYTEYNTSMTKDRLVAPVKAVEYLNENAGRDSRIFTEFNSGGYLAWNGYQIYMEARPELYFKAINKKADVFAEYEEVTGQISPERFDEFQNQYQFEYYIVGNWNPLGTHLEYDDDFEMVLEADEYKIWAVMKD